MANISIDEQERLMHLLFSLDDLTSLSINERQALRETLFEQLKRLDILFRSDWHAGMEAILRLDTRSAENGSARIDAEERLGVAPPRIDFIVWLQDPGTRMPKAIYKDFRQFNIIEYKSPHDQLNWRTIHKAIGYASLYVGLADNEGERPRDQVTISIFRATKNHKLFKELERSHQLVEDETKGIYHITGLTEFPFQIVIMTELEGDEYAAERSLVDNDKAEIRDIQQLTKQYKQETDETARELMEVILDLISHKNPVSFDNARRSENHMFEELKKIFATEIDKAVQDGISEKEEQLSKEREQLGKEREQLGEREEQLGEREEQLGEREEQLSEREEQLNEKEKRVQEQEEKQHEEGARINMFSLVAKRLLALDIAAQECHLSIADFAQEMQQNGFALPA